MSKKLINDPTVAVDDALRGIAAVHPGICQLEGHPRVLVRSDIEAVKRDGKVTILSGGGSGHEPAHAGYVGKGMLSAAVSGSVFASPPPADILAALRCISGSAGTLMVVKNYTGDRLNFGIAAESAKAEGLRVEMVIVGEDCALARNAASAGRRGLCGTVLVHKIAGGVAENGCTLEEVVSAAAAVAGDIATMSVSLSACSIPGQEASFRLEKDEMELGLGIHGEAGIKRTKLQTADTVAMLLVDHMINPDDNYFKLTPGDPVGVVINNLGGTSNLELAVMANSVIRYLVDVKKVMVRRAYMGALMTSLEMAGVSVTLIRLTPNREECLDAPTTAPGWPTVSPGVGGSRDRVDKPSLQGAQLPAHATITATQSSPSSQGGVLLRACTEQVCRSLLANEDLLNQLDRSGGDGDCGTTLSSGARVVLDRLSLFPWDTPGDCLLSLSECIGAHMGGTSGAIYSLLLTAVSSTLRQHEGPVDGTVWIRSLQNGMGAVKRYGGAELGDRTMLDALSPAIGVLEQSSALDGLHGAVEAAEQGAEATRTMAARSGRASYVNPELLSERDPGAVAVTVWLQALHTALSNDS